MSQKNFVDKYLTIYTKETPLIYDHRNDRLYTGFFSIEKCMKQMLNIRMNDYLEYGKKVGEIENFQFLGSEDGISGLAIAGMGYEIYNFRHGGGSNDELGGAKPFLNFLKDVSRFPKYYRRIQQRVIPVMDSYNILYEYGTRRFPLKYIPYDKDFSDYIEFSCPVLILRTLDCKCDFCKQFRDSEKIDKKINKVDNESDKKSINECYSYNSDDECYSYDSGDDNYHYHSSDDNSNNNNFTPWGEECENEERFEKFQKYFTTANYENLDELYKLAKAREEFIEKHIDYIFPHLKGNLFTDYEIEDYRINNIVPVILGVPEKIIKMILGIKKI